MEEFRRRVHTQAIRIEIQLSISRPKAIFQWFIAIVMFMRTSNEANTHTTTPLAVLRLASLELPHVKLQRLGISKEGNRETQAQ